MKLFSLVLICNYLFQGVFAVSIAAQETTEAQHNNQIDVSPEVIKDSPVLQKWLEEIPDVLKDITYDPAFATRLHLGFSTFPSTNNESGIHLSITDIFIKSTGLTISADYQTAFNGSRNAVGLDVHYFLLPLGSYLNFAPLVGYRYVQSNDYFTDGVRLGFRLMMALSRTGGGDISLSQSLINLGGKDEVGITSLSVGYGVTSHLRLSGNIEWQNSIEEQDNRFGVGLEWLF